MARRTDSEGQKLKPRGRPFAKGNKRGKLENVLLDDDGHKECDPGTSLDKEKDLMVSIINSTEEKPINETNENEQDDGFKLVDSIEFVNGKNVLTLRLTVKQNRSFKTEVWLNNETEIRRATYLGASSGMAYWNLLKGALRK